MEQTGVEDHPAFGLGQGLLGSVYLGLQPCPLLAEGVGRHIIALFGVQADQAHLLILELGDQGRLGLVHAAGRLLADADQRSYGSVAALYVLGTQLDRTLAVVASDGGLDQLGADVGPHLAFAAVDAAGAEEVGVLAAVLTGGQPEGQALAAFSAENRALEVVLAVLGALASDPLFLKPSLDQIEGVLVNQRLMAAGEYLLAGRAALVDDPSGVIGVAEDALQGRRADPAGGGRMAFGGPGPQPQAVQLFGELGHRVFAAGVQLEGDSQEVMAVGIGFDAGYLAAIGQHFGRVEIAEARGAKGAAVFGLLEQAAFDALAGQHRLVLVVGDDHALIQEARGGVLTGHRLGDGDQASAGLVDQLAGLPVIHGVARPSGQAPDDHVVHASRGVFVVLFQLVQHFEEAGALVQIDVGALAGVGELADNLGIELGGLVGGSLALRTDRQPIRVVVGMDLAFGGNAQVDEGSLVQRGFGGGRLRVGFGHITPFCLCILPSYVLYRAGFIAPHLRIARC